MRLIEPSCSIFGSTSSRLDWIACRRLLNSCAIPPVNWPTACSRCVRSSASSILFLSVTSRVIPQTPLTSPARSRRGISDVSTTRCSPSIRQTYSPRTESPATTRWSMSWMEAAMWASNNSPSDRPTMSSTPFPSDRAKALFTCVYRNARSFMKMKSSTVSNRVRRRVSLACKSSSARRRAWFSSRKSKACLLKISKARAIAPTSSVRVNPGTST